MPKERLGFMSLLPRALAMDLHSRPIREETVMYAVQGCLLSAAFLFSGVADYSYEGQPSVAAYCNHHAKEAAGRLGHPWPLPVRRVPERVQRTRVSRAG